MSLAEIIGPLLSKAYQEKVAAKHQRQKGENEPEYASFLQRALACFIDGAIVVIPTVTLATLLAGGVHQTGSGLCLVLWMLYSAIMESSEKQATFGKAIFKIKVTDLDNRRLSFGKALGRNLAKIVSTLVFGLGYIFPLFTDKNQALHDLIANTLVAREGQKRVVSQIKPRIPTRPQP